MSADEVKHAAPPEPDSNIARIYKHLVPPGPTALSTNTLWHHYRGPSGPWQGKGVRDTIRSLSAAS